jgi:hypothetical protein
MNADEIRATIDDRKVGDEFPCACGCGGIVVITSIHRTNVRAGRRPWPTQLKHHRRSQTNFPYRVGDEYPCKCGCGENVVITKYHRKNNYIPKYIKTHIHRDTSKPGIVCKIIYDAAKDVVDDKDSLLTDSSFVSDYIGKVCDRVDRGEITKPKYTIKENRALAAKITEAVWDDDRFVIDNDEERDWYRMMVLHTTSESLCFTHMLSKRLRLSYNLPYLGDEITEMLRIGHMKKVGNLYRTTLSGELWLIDQSKK